MTREVFSSSDYEDDPRVRALEDGAGRSPCEAEWLVKGGYVSQSTTPATRSHSRRRRPARSSYADGENELDPHWNPPFDMHQSSEERARAAEASHRGLSEATDIFTAMRREKIENNPNLTTQEKVQKLQELALREAVRRNRRGE